jgi:KUP system potassium uptake protein
VSGSASHEKEHPTGKVLAGLSLGAIGVVYGDIGTSPLYAIQQAFTGHHSVAPTPANILGVLSLVFWALTFVISFKYIGFVMRADNRGEGGVLALLALVRPRGGRATGHWLLVGVGLFGAALLYGDGIITPAITVLSAVEGLSESPALEHLVIPIAIIILTGLFWMQKHGTALIGRVFGPIMVTWFVCIAALGLHGILMHPSVLAALNPWHAIDLFIRDKVAGFLVLSAVVLVVTGGEALYADMGHFGKRPIRVAWFALCLPSLLLNYFGQAALLLEQPAAAVNPFYELVPDWFHYPMVVIATLAAIVASQALISGAFSLTRQAVQLGYSPRVTIVHTSSSEMGQIYIPEINHALGVACILLVLGFQNSTNLAAAYGVAVNGTMIITSLLFHRVARDRWHWSFWQAGLLTGLFLAVDLAFFAANLVKISDGGWFPLMVAGVAYILMTTWKRGRDKLADIVQQNSLPLSLFLQDIERRKPVRVPGIAVFMTSATGVAPPVLLHHLKHNKVLHERVILMSVITEEVPVVWDKERIESRDLGAGFYQVIVRTGFMETPNVPAVLRRLDDGDIKGSPGLVSIMQTSFFLGRETLIATHYKRGASGPAGEHWMTYWRKKLFVVMTRNARSATAFYGLPPNRVVELGAQIQI